MERTAPEVTSVNGMLMCSLCCSQWEDHFPFVEEDVSAIEGCVQALGRRIAEVDARTAGIDRISSRRQGQG